MSMIKYPTVRRDTSIVDDYHGTLIADPYRWLEEAQSNDDVKNFVKEQNELTDNYTKSCNVRERLREKLTNLMSFSEYECPFQRGERYFYFHDGLLYKLESLNEDQGGCVVLDPTSESVLVGCKNVALSSSLFEKTGENFGSHLCSVTNNGEYLAYGISESGSVWNTIHFKNVSTMTHLPEKLEYVQDTYLSWTLDNKGLFYGRYPDKNVFENEAIYHHLLGTDQSEDRKIVEFPENPKWELKSKVSDCGHYLIIYVLADCGGHTNVYIIPMNKIFADLNHNSEQKMDSIQRDLIPVITEFNGDYDYITNSVSTFYFLTNKDAPNSKVVSIDLPTQMSIPKKIQVVREHRKDVLDWAICVNHDYLITCYMRDVKSILQLRKLLDGSLLRTFPLDLGTIVGYCGRRDSSEVFFKFSSFLTPGTIYHLDFKDQKEKGRCSCGCFPNAKNDFKFQMFRESLVNHFDASMYSIKQIFYRSKDRTKVPMFLVHEKSLIKNGDNACLLIGYGGFSTSLKPSFDPTSIVFIKHFNGIFAVANIRGGGEYGKHWYEGGINLKKQNSFDDFHAAAEYLINKRYTSAKKLVIKGDSNGGLLVAACINQRPELFGAAVAGYGVMDMLRFQKFTTGSCWISDYGCSDNPEDFENLRCFSPLHNARMPVAVGIQYPFVLLITADHDERVLPLHSYKMIAELQQSIGSNQKQENPLLLRIETNSGHGDGMSFDSAVDEVTDILTFIMLGLKLRFLE